MCIGGYVSLDGALVGDLHCGPAQRLFSVELSLTYAGSYEILRRSSIITIL